MPSIIWFNNGANLRSSIVNSEEKTAFYPQDERQEVHLDNYPFTQTTWRSLATTSTKSSWLAMTVSMGL